MTSLTVVQGNACWHDRATKSIGPTTHQINWYCPDCGQTRTTYPPPFASPPEAPAASTHASLMRFYSVDTTDALISAQAHHIEKLQSKLQPAPSFASRRVREG